METVSMNCLLVVSLMMMMVSHSCICPGVPLENKKMTMKVDITDSLGHESQVKTAESGLLVDTANLLNSAPTQEQDIEELDYDPFITKANGILKPLETLDNYDDNLYNEEVGSQVLRRVKRCGGGGDDDDDGDANRSRSVRRGSRVSRRKTRSRKVRRRAKKARAKARKAAKKAAKEAENNTKTSTKTVVVTKKIIKSGDDVDLDD